VGCGKGYGRSRTLASALEESQQAHAPNWHKSGLSCPVNGPHPPSGMRIILIGRWPHRKGTMMRRSPEPNPGGRRRSSASARQRCLERPAAAYPQVRPVDKCPSTPVFRPCAPGLCPPCADNRWSIPLAILPALHFLPPKKEMSTNKRQHPPFVSANCGDYLNTRRALARSRATRPSGLIAQLFSGAGVRRSHIGRCLRPPLLGWRRGFRPLSASRAFILNMLGTVPGRLWLPDPGPWRLQLCVPARNLFPGSNASSIWFCNPGL
jgi:hypothetical protein